MFFLLFLFCCSYSVWWWIWFKWRKQLKMESLCVSLQLKSSACCKEFIICSFVVWRRKVKFESWFSKSNCDVSNVCFYVKDVFFVKIMAPNQFSWEPLFQFKDALDDIFWIFMGFCCIDMEKLDCGVYFVLKFLALILVLSRIWQSLVLFSELL